MTIAAWAQGGLRTSPNGSTCGEWGEGVWSGELQRVTGAAGEYVSSLSLVLY